MRGDDNGVIYRGQLIDDESLDSNYGDDKFSGNGNIENYRVYNDVDTNENERIETLDAESDNYYKYLFFILLLFIIFIFIHYKRNNGSGLGF